MQSPFKIGSLKFDRLLAPAIIALASLLLSCGDIYSDLVENNPVNRCFGKPYMVIYYGNGSTSGLVPFDFNCYGEGETATVLGNIGNMRGQYIVAGWITQRFTGWNSASDGSGTAYAPGATMSISGRSVFLYAQWTSGVSVIGKIGPAGGHVYYDNGSYTGSPPWRYMECTPEDVATRWPEWGCFGSVIPGADGAAMGDGYQNTLDIIAGCAMPNTAARLCDEYQLNGYSDWFLPSRAELTQIYNNIYMAGIVNNWATYYYWSSTEFSANGAWARWMGTGETGASKGDSNISVRAARRF